MNDRNKTSCFIVWMGLWFGAILIWSTMVWYSLAETKMVFETAIYACAFLVLGILGFVAGIRIQSKVHGLMVFLICVLLAVLSVMFHDFFADNDFLYRVAPVILIAESAAYCFAKDYVPRYSTHSNWFRRKSAEIMGLITFFCGISLAYVRNDWDGWLLLLMVFGVLFLSYSIYFNRMIARRPVPLQS